MSGGARMRRMLQDVHRIGVRGARRVARSANARANGFVGGRLPLGSRVIGAERIRVGRGFDAAQPVWFEAVEEYAGVRHDPWIEIGEGFTSSGRTHVSAIGRIEIGQDCLFGSNVYVGDHGHGDYAGPEASDPAVPPRARPLVSRGGIRIGDRVWVGDNAVVLQGVRIGDGAVIGANAVVTADVPAGAVAAGAPARVLRRWNARSRTWEREASVTER